jgi:hypothetical protein
VQRVYARVGKFVLACLILIGFAAIASLGTTLGTSLSAGSLQSLAPTPAEVVAARFPSADARPPVVPATYSTASVLPAERWEMFSPSPSYPQITAHAPLPTASESAAMAASEPVQQPAAKVATAKSEAPKASSASAPARRVANRPGGVLNDAQIANIKGRLNLTPEQEQMWPAVETALRKITYTKNATSQQVHAAQSSSERMAYIDPSSAEVQQLKYAALPLIMRLNDDQRREVKMMAHVMGLEGVASQF